MRSPIGGFFRGRVSRAVDNFRAIPYNLHAISKGGVRLISNEVLLVLSLFFIYGAGVLCFYFFEENGLICFMAMATIAANIEVMMLVDAFGMEQTLGNVLFASTFLVTDCLSELYGKKAANKAVNIGIFVSAFFIILTQTWFLYTPAANDFITPAIREVFSNTPRMMIAGITVYAVVQWFDVWVYHRIWAFTEKRFGSRRQYLWFRNNGSTLISQLVNTVLFTIAAFWGIYDGGTLVSIAVSTYVIYIVTSIADTPIVYLIRRIHEKRQSKLA